jgi:hypothetical protein
MILRLGCLCVNQVKIAKVRVGGEAVARSLPE